MSKTFDRVVMLGIIIGMIFLTLFLLMQNTNKAIGSVESSAGAYQATSTRNSTGNPIASTTSLVTSSSGVSGVFGGCNITGAGNAATDFYDATTSNATLRTITATSSLKLIASYSAGLAAGNYTGLDGEFKDGLLMVTTGSSNSVATATCSWKL